MKTRFSLTRWLPVVFALLLHCRATSGQSPSITVRISYQEPLSITDRYYGNSVYFRERYRDSLVFMASNSLNSCGSIKVVGGVDPIGVNVLANCDDEYCKNVVPYSIDETNLACAGGVQTVFLEKLDGRGRPILYVFLDTEANVLYLRYRYTFSKTQ